MADRDRRVAPAAAALQGTDGPPQDLEATGLLTSGGGSSAAGAAGSRPRRRPAPGVGPQLLLDAGGVIVGEVRGFFLALEREHGLAPGALQADWNGGARDATWSGRWGEAQFWDWLRERLPGPPPASELGAALARAMTPLPPFELVPRWAERADVSVLSNHRLAWLGRALGPLRPALSHLFVSDQLGLVKPQPAIYAHVEARLDGAPVLLVDNQGRNLEAAASRGWETLLADREGTWTRHVEAWLGAVPQRAGPGLRPLSAG